VKLHVDRPSINATIVVKIGNLWIEVQAGCLFPQIGHRWKRFAQILVPASILHFVFRRSPAATLSG
jgi:hypothetical protein